MFRKQAKLVAALLGLGVSLVVSLGVSLGLKRGLGAWVAWGLVLGLLGSLALNVRLWRWLSLERRWRAELSLDPVGLSYLADRQADLQADLKAGQGSQEAMSGAGAVVLVGDSRANEWWQARSEGVPEGRSARVPEGVDDRPGRSENPGPPIVWLNQGIDGQTSEQIALRFRASWDPRAEMSLAIPPQVLPPPRLIIIQAGVNDLMRIPIFPDRRDALVARCRRSLWILIQDARATGATVVVTTIFPLGEQAAMTQPQADIIQAAIAEVNQFLRETVAQAQQERRGLDAQGVERQVADRKTSESEALGSLEILESGPLLTHASGWVKLGYSRDGLHLNRAGYKVLNQALVAAGLL